MKSIKKTFTLTSARALVYDRDLGREVEKSFDFKGKVSPKRAEKMIKEQCTQSSMAFLNFKEIRDHKVTFIMPFDKFISLAEKVGVSADE